MDAEFVRDIEDLGAIVQIQGNVVDITFPETMPRRLVIEAALWAQSLGPNGLASDPVFLPPNNGDITVRLEFD